MFYLQSTGFWPIIYKWAGAIGGVSVVVSALGALLSFVGKRYLDYRLQKERQSSSTVLENIKNEFQSKREGDRQRAEREIEELRNTFNRQLEADRQEFDLKLESLRSANQRRASVAKSQFDFEFEALREIWGATATLMADLRQLSLSYTMHDLDVKNSRYKTAADNHHKFADKYQRYSAFIEEDLADLLGDFSRDSYNEIDAFAGSIIAQQKELKDYDQTLAEKEARRMVREELLKSVAEIEEQVRKRMEFLKESSTD